jgi:hypothetical protein
MKTMVDGMADNKVYHLWITAPDSTYEEILVTKLVERGYAISASDGKETSLKSDNGFSIVIALRIERLSGKEFSVQELYLDVMTVITDANGKHYSVVLSPFSVDTTWCASNAGIPELKTTNTYRKLN